MFDLIFFAENESEKHSLESTLITRQPVIPSNYTAVPKYAKIQSKMSE